MNKPFISPLNRYRMLQDRLAKYRLTHGELESAESQEIMGEMDEVWSELTEKERDTSMQPRLTLAEMVEQVEAKTSTTDPIGLAPIQTNDQVRKDCQTRYEKICKRAWEHGANAVISFSDWSNGFFANFDLKPGLEIRGGKNLDKPNYSNFSLYTSAVLTAKQSAELFHAAWAGRTNAPPNSMLYAFCFPVGFALPSQAVAAIMADEALVAEPSNNV